ncbi:MAG: GTP-binding protein [Desulfococcus sp. 4484_241]|nr:MAG: GTP-binding protein [Desulfococcus sp. 4484_241]
MSTPAIPEQAKLVIGVFLKDRDLIGPIAESLAKEFGPPDMVSRWLPFDYTDYYEPEFGSPLYRRIFSFASLVEQDSLADVKLVTNEIEKRFTSGKKRLANIDPGFLTRERFVLATGKNFAHRIYLGRGIYADLTLIYRKKEFHALEWTYPDYAQGDLNRFLLLARERYVWGLQANSSRP